ncbi:si:ch211-191a24.3 isoform X2 [Antennarius striatus]|uniref:si:ch211-191a24.3 isoform X2 n=1 Tax=Antennarius striatus TaxID=241820 RepID=UPI0035AFF4C9
MDDVQQMDLTYVTERIIIVFCPPRCPEETYRQSLQEILLMLQSKHAHNCMLINVSQRSDALSGMNLEVLDTGWLDLLAPNLNQIFSVCTAMENWLEVHPKHVLVLHCRGGKGRLGVLVASYIHFSNMSASADLSLDRFAMRKFYTDKLSPLMTPSQKRYVWTLGSMLKGGLRMSPSPSFLLCIVLHGLPKLRPDGGCCLFLRVYQSLQAVCTSAVYHANATQTDQLYLVLQPAQLLMGDIMVVCYDKNSRLSSRQVVFRVQFHTGLIHGHTLTFFKADLDCASEDPRFPDDGKVELFFSDGPEKIRGRELWHNGAGVTVDYDTLDPLVRRDSYRDATPTVRAPAHVLHPGNGQVRKKSSKEEVLCPQTASCSERTPSASSDSGLSVASQGQTGPGKKAGATRDKGVRAGKLVPGVDFEIVQPLLEVMAELAASGGKNEMDGDESGMGLTTNGEASSSERETDILDDEDRGVTAQALDVPSSNSVCSISSENLPKMQTEYSTQSWVRQQQAADGVMDTYRRKPPPLEAPDTPTRGICSREAVQRRLADQDIASNGGTQPVNEPPQQEDLESLTTDIDESIEQLNQLILDLDPTFVPVPTRCPPVSRSASLQSNGLSQKAGAHQSGWRQQKQISDVVDYAGWRGGRAQSSRDPPLRSPPSPAQHGPLYNNRSPDCRGPQDRSDVAPPTPAFPVSPPTPYVKHFSEFRTGGQWTDRWPADSRGFLDSIGHGGGSTSDGDLFREDVSATPTSCQRIFGSVCSVSSESPLPHTDSSTPPPVWLDRTPDSHHSPYPPHPSPPPSLSTPNAHSSPRRTLKGLGGSLGVHQETHSPDFCSLLLGNGNGGLEHSLLEAVEGLGSLDLGGHGGLPPLLPEKRRGGDVGDLGSHSPSLSGFSSPHSGSSLSIPFSSPMTPDSLRGLSGAPSPGSDSGSKQDTVKFVQDTSKFWYKPDISRDQAIVVLKDKEPGSFVVRDSHSFRGAYGLAMKVATPPPSVVQQSKKAGDLANELVRHFLIECTQKGVRLKGCPNEPYFGSLTALVCQHSITPLALPCKLILPNRDPMEELNDSSPQTSSNSAAELLKQGAACNVWYLGSVALESLTGHQAVQKATTLTLSMDPPPASTVVHFKVSAQGITLTDNQRKWTRDSGSTAKIFGFVARKSQSETENMCHLFAEHDPEQPASAIVNFVSKVMIGSHKK